jgi:sugar lactone lactonase YvrE
MKSTSNLTAGVCKLAICLTVFLSQSTMLLHADFAYVPALGRVSEVVTGTGQRLVASGWNLSASGYVAVDPTTGNLYTADQGDRAVYRINRTNGIIKMVSGPGIGTGPAFSARVYGIVVETNGNPVVVDGYGGLLAVIRVDAQTGNRTVLSAGSNSPYPAGMGAGFQSPVGIAMDSSGNFLVTDTLRQAVIRVDRVSGNRTTLSGDPFGDNTGTGPDMNTPQGIAVAGDGSIFVSANGTFEINPTNGNRTNITSSAGGFYGISMGTNGLVMGAYKLTINNNYAGGKVLGVNPLTAGVITISCTGDGLGNPAVGTGANFYDPVGITVDNNGLPIISDVLVRSLFVIDPTTGNRSVLPNSRRGGGIDLYTAKGVAIGTNGSIVVADDGDSTVYQSGFNTIMNQWPLLVAIDSNTGDRSVLSAGSNTGVQRGSGSNFQTPEGVACENSGTFVVADSGSSNPKVVRVDPATGNRTILSSSSVGTGTSFVAPYGIAVESSGTFIVTDTGLNAVLRVDPITGNRTVLSGSGVGGGPAFSQLRGVAVLPDGTIAVTDAELGAVVLVNNVAGNRTILSSASVGTGPTFSSPCGIAETWQGNLLVVDKSTATVFEVDRSTGNRTVVSSVSVGSGSYIQQSPEFVATTPPLELSSPQRQMGGGMQFNLYSPLGRQCVIEESTNLTAWTQLTNFTTATITNIVSDSTTETPIKFYRAHFQ